MVVKVGKTAEHRFLDVEAAAQPYGCIPEKILAPFTHDVPPRLLLSNRQKATIHTKYDEISQFSARYFIIFHRRLASS
jgi:hypothetical protein